MDFVVLAVAALPRGWTTSPVLMMTGWWGEKVCVLKFWPCVWLRDSEDVLCQRPAERLQDPGRQVQPGRHGGGEWTPPHIAVRHSTHTAQSVLLCGGAGVGTWVSTSLAWITEVRCHVTKQPGVAAQAHSLSSLCFTVNLWFCHLSSGGRAGQWFAGFDPRLRPPCWGGSVEVSLSKTPHPYRSRRAGCRHHGWLHRLCVNVWMAVTLG